MKKTSLYHEADVDRRLAQLAAVEGVTKAEYIRRILRQRVEDSPPAIIRALGVGTGPGDVATEVDRHLEEPGFGADRP